MKSHLGATLAGLVVAGLLVVVVGCESDPKSARGFRLPDGDVERGKAAFMELQCTSCHTVDGVNLPRQETPPPMSVALGGEVRKIRTYGELVTSIINPSHTLAPGYPQKYVGERGKSRMEDYNQVMTVSQMIDLVAFLQSRYRFVVPPPSRVG
jgi:hypothetical protein